MLSKQDPMYPFNRNVIATGIHNELLNNLIEKQKKVMKIYLNKNKHDKYQIIDSSLQLLLKYREIFLKWFSENKI